MRYNKKGVSGVVTVLIIVALSLLAIGLVWRVILPIFTEGTQNIDYGAKCLEVNLKPTSLVCTLDGAVYNCDVGLKRDAGTGNAEFDGVVALYSDNINDKTISDGIGNIEVLGIGKTTILGLSFNPTKVKIAAYFLKEDKTKYTCPGTTEYNA